MTDIVERLRGGYKFGDSDTVLEAADRIAELGRELAAETNNKQEFERDWLECCNRLNDERIANREEESVLNGKLAAAQAREKVLRDALESVRQYGSDTLSGRIDGPDDRAWQRGAVLEMTRRARIAINQPTDDTALNNLLAEGQANNKMLRDALFELANLHVVVHSQSPEGRAYMKKLGDLMASSDDTALKAAIQHGIAEFLERTGQYVTNDASCKAALKAERERVAKHFEARSYLGSGHQLAIEIRALKDE